MTTTTERSKVVALAATATTGAYTALVTNDLPNDIGIIEITKVLLTNTDATNASRIDIRINEVGLSPALAAGDTTRNLYINHSLAGASDSARLEPLEGLILDDDAILEIRSQRVVNVFVSWVEKARAGASFR